MILKTLIQKDTVADRLLPIFFSPDQEIEPEMRNNFLKATELVA